jgi:uncharacterized membrane protein YfcA
LWLSVGALAGAFVGASLLAIISKRNLALVFAIVLTIVGIRLFFTVNGDGRGEITIVIALAYVLVGLATGALSGLLGIGGGAIMVPIMAVLFGIPSVIAKGTSLAVIIPTALMGTVRNRSNANVDMTAAVVVGIGGGNGRRRRMGLGSHVGRGVECAVCCLVDCGSRPNVATGLERDC